MIDLSRMPKDDDLPSVIRDNMVEIAGDDNLVFLDGFDHCILGICSIYGEVPRVAYSVELIIKALQKNEMSYEEATEFFDFNIGCLHTGPYTPALIVAGPNVDVTSDT
jgi:hypothetical protein